MTTQKPASCPHCKSQALIFVRDGEWTEGVDNLVCSTCGLESCRGEASTPRLAPAGLGSSV